MLLVWILTMSLGLGSLARQGSASDAAAILGTWLLVATESQAGRNTTDKNVNNVSLVFGEGGAYSVKPKGFEFAGRYTIDAVRHTLDITVEKRTVLAVYDLQGNQLRICEGEAARPKEMRPSECAKSVIGVYQRQ